MYGYCRHLHFQGSEIKSKIRNMCKAIREWLATVDFKDKHMFEHNRLIYNPTLIENLSNKFLFYWHVTSTCNLSISWGRDGDLLRVLYSYC